ncbi:transcriptional regulator, TetR family [Rhizobiales bacterium GAS113]|nr:transcriptional regulator, TetR family [Rhizobiales bacterium GAS113]
MSSGSPLSATRPVPPTTDPIGPATDQAQTELDSTNHFAPLLRPRRPRSSSAGAAVPDGHPETPRTSGPPDIAGKTRRPAACAVGVETAAKPAASPRLYRDLRCDPQDTATRILLETERLLRVYGHRKITVADVADACGFSATNVYRYFSSRRAILDTLASHYLHEAERAALACAIRSGDSARDRLSGFLTDLNKALTIFSDFEPQLSELLADATAERWPCYSHYDALVVCHIARILAEGSASGEFRLEDDTKQEARRVKAAACALVEPDVIRLCRDKHDVRTREALSRLIAAALLKQSVPPCCASPQGVTLVGRLPIGEMQWP